MKTFTHSYRIVRSLGLAVLAVLTFECEGQVLIDDHMEGYPTATATSVYRNVSTSNPANWQSVVYQGSGTLTATAGIGTGNGNPDQAAVMTTNFAGTTSYAGSMLNSASYGNGTPPTQGTTFSDFHFSVDLRGSQAAAVSVIFISMNSSSGMTGTMSKTFTLTAANTYQTFSGNLGEPGWTPDSSKAGGAQMDLHAPYYRWSLLIQAENPGGWGFDAGNVVDMDNVKLTSQSGGAYLPVTYDAVTRFFYLNSGQGPYVGYKPDNYNEAVPISLFVWMHGCGGNAEGDMWSIAPPPTRQSQSYIAISLGGRDGACWKVNTDTPKVLAAITDVARYFNINPRKIYLGGYSSGGDMTYRVGFQNASLFAGLLVENSDPFRDTGAPNAYLSASWKLNIAHLAHLSDTTYPIATVRTNMATLTTNSFPVTKIEKVGTHYDADNGAFGTNYDLIHFLLPYLDAGWVSLFPDITVEQPADTSIADGGAQSFVTLPGVPTSLTFTITNPGSASLTLLQITKDGTNTADFTITTNPPAPVASGGTTAFTVQFLSNTSAVKTAVIHIANNVTGKNPYDINLTGRALSYSQDMDDDGMSDAAEFQWSALGFNWQTSQPALVSTFNANASAAGFFTTSQVQTLNVGAPLIQRDATTGLFKLIIALKKTTNPTLPFSDFPMNVPGTSAVINGLGKLEFEFAAPDNAAFFRLESAPRPLPIEPFGSVPALKQIN